MKIVVLHRDPLAGDGGRSDAPVSGEGLRARVHVDALRAAGHDVVAIHRWERHLLADPEGWSTPPRLVDAVRAERPDAVVCTSLTDAPAVAPVAPLVVDLYAPRVLEGGWQGLQHEEARLAVAAVEAADEILTSNERQRWYWLGILGLAGWDLTRPAGLVVPLAALPGPTRRPQPRFIAGGSPWPWQDPRPTLARAVAHLRGRAEVVTYGLPAVAGVTSLPRGGRDAWLEACATATAALDRYVANPERTLAYSFRQADYLGCGLPLVSDPDTPLADQLRAHRAGWVDEALEDALDAALVEDRSPGVAALAEAYAPARTEAPLVAWQPTRRERPWSLLAAGATLAHAEVRAAAAERALEVATVELGKKHDEVRAASEQARALASSVEALSAAMLDVAGLRREVVQVLGARLGGEAATREQLAREVEVLRADLAKKDAELGAAQAEHDRLGRALAWLRGQR